LRAWLERRPKVSSLMRMSSGTASITKSAEASASKLGSRESLARAAFAASGDSFPRETAPSKSSEIVRSAASRALSDTSWRSVLKPPAAAA
jgi:hypothetical protein